MILQERQHGNSLEKQVCDGSQETKDSIKLPKAWKEGILFHSTQVSTVSNTGNLLIFNILKLILDNLKILVFMSSLSQIVICHLAAWQI